MVLLGDPVLLEILTYLLSYTSNVLSEKGMVDRAMPWKERRPR